MPENPGTFEIVALELGHVFEPIAEMFHEPHRAIQFLAELGLKLPPDGIPPALENAFAELHTAAHSMAGLTTDLADAITAGDPLQIVAKGVPLAQQIAASI